MMGRPGEKVEVQDDFGGLELGNMLSQTLWGNTIHDNIILTFLAFFSPMKVFPLFKAQNLEVKSIILIVFVRSCVVFHFLPWRLLSLQSCETLKPQRSKRISLLEIRTSTEKKDLCSVSQFAFVVVKRKQFLTSTWELRVVESESCVDLCSRKRIQSENSELTKRSRLSTKNVEYIIKSKCEGEMIFKVIDVIFAFSQRTLIHTIFYFRSFHSLIMQLTHFHFHFRYLTECLKIGRRHVMEAAKF